MNDAPADQKTPELVLIFDNARPLAAADLGELFSAMARDYRQLTRGSTLVVARLETGSLLAYLRDALTEITPYGQDALTVIKAFTDLKEFLLRLKGLFGRVREHPGELKHRRRIGTKSLEAFVKIAAVSNTVVELHYEIGEGERIDLKVTPVEAIRIQELKTVLSSPSTTPSLFQPSAYVDSLAHLYGPLEAKAGPIAETDIRAAMAALANSLISIGRGSLVPVIASDLERRGYPNLARILRAEAQSLRRGQAPP